MRVLHVVPSYLPAWRYGGPIRSVHALARAQVAAGNDVEVFTTDADGPERLPVPSDRAVVRDGVRVRYFSVGRPARYFRSPGMARALKRGVGAFEVVHIHAMFLWPVVAAARAARRASVPYVVAPRGMLVDGLIRRRGRHRKRLWIGLFGRRILARAAAIHATSGKEAEEIASLGLDVAPMVVIENGVELRDELESDGENGEGRRSSVRSGEPYLLCLGRIAGKKRIDRAIEAVAGVPGPRLVIAGNDDEALTPGLRDLARSLGVAERVDFVGEVRGAAKWDLLERSVALLLPSASENLGNVVLESLAAGRPAIVSREVGAGQMVAAADAGRVLGDDPEEWREAIRDLIVDPEGATAMGRRGRELVHRELSWARIAGRVQACYEDAIKNAGKERA